MGLANYKIFGQPGEWHVEHDGKVANAYETKESAFEAAAAAASIALRQGHEIMITAGLRRWHRNDHRRKILKVADAAKKYRAARRS
jgi:hypothetical protein